jgi:adenylate cyclase
MPPLGFVDVREAETYHFISTRVFLSSRNVNNQTHTQQSFRKIVYACIVGSALLALGLAHTRAGEWLENGTHDARSRWTAQPEKSDPRVVIIDIDNASYSLLQDKLGRWPWPRTVWTEVIRYVSRGRPAAIAVDIVFGGEDKSSTAADPEFARVLRSSGKTTLAFAFLSTEVTGDDVNKSGQRREILASQASTTGFGSRLAEEEWNPNLPLETLATAAAGLGSINSTPDEGGTIRRTPVQFQFAGHGYLTLGARAVQIASGSREPFQWHQSRGILDRNFVSLGEKQIPLDPEGRLVLLWRGNSFEAYPRVPLWEVICSIYPEQCPNAEHRFLPEYFRDKVVLLGASAAGSYEPRPTPMDAQAPGFMVHATLIDNLLNGEALRLAPSWLLLLGVLVMAILGGMLQLKFRSVVPALTILAATFLFYFVLSVWAFQKMHFVFPMVAPGLALLLSYAGAGISRYAITGRELRQTRGVLERYVAPQLVDYVMSNLSAFQLKGDKRELTILISDVRNFTTMTEKSDPEELIALLDDYLAAMTEIIFKHNGIVDKFIGDGILAYWGAFTPQKNHAEEAAFAALEMIGKLKELNQRWESQGKQPISIGIGINTGTVVFGNIGKGKKIEFTVIGDAVNLAARLEGLNKEFGTSIVISEETRARLGANVETRTLGGVKVKGKTIETQVFELRGFLDDERLRNPSKELVDTSNRGGEAA